MPFVAFVALLLVMTVGRIAAVSVALWVGASIANTPFGLSSWSVRRSPSLSPTPH